MLRFIPLGLVSEVFEKNQVEISEQKERKCQGQSKTLLYSTLLGLLQPKQCVMSYKSKISFLSLVIINIS